MLEVSIYHLAPNSWSWHSKVYNFYSKVFNFHPKVFNFHSKFVTFTQKIISSTPKSIISTNNLRLCFTQKKSITLFNFKKEIQTVLYTENFQTVEAVLTGYRRFKPHNKQVCTDSIQDSGSIKLESYGTSNYGLAFLVSLKSLILFLMTTRHLKDLF